MLVEESCYEGYGAVTVSGCAALILLEVLRVPHVSSEVWIAVRAISRLRDTMYHICVQQIQELTEYRFARLLRPGSQFYPGL